MTSPASEIDIRDLKKTYRSRRGRVSAIDGLDLSIEQGQFISILGPSGCGKSTLLMCMAGLDLYDSGQINVSGSVINGKPYSDCGVVFQAAELLEWRSAVDNVLLQTEVRGINSKSQRERAVDLLRQVGLKGFEDSYPRELSGGMQQRVALCRALIHDPATLLMDEPFGALDALTRDQMNKDLERIWMDTGKTVVFVTHSISEAVALGDRVIVLTPRPARIALDLTIDLPRPRRMDARMVELLNTVRGTFESLGVLHD